MSATDTHPVAGVNGARTWKRFFSRRVQLLLDVTAVALAFGVAYVLRFEFAIPRPVVYNVIVQLPWVVAIHVASLFAFGVYSLIWRYVGLAELRRFVGAACVATVPLLVGRAALPEGLRDFRVPVSVTLMTAAFAFGGVLGLRVFRRMVYERYERQATEGRSTRRRRTGGGARDS